MCRVIKYIKCFQNRSGKGNVEFTHYSFFIFLLLRTPHNQRLAGFVVKKVSFLCVILAAKWMCFKQIQIYSERSVKAICVWEPLMNDSWDPVARKIGSVVWIPGCMINSPTELLCFTCKQSTSSSFHHSEFAEKMWIVQFWGSNIPLKPGGTCNVLYKLCSPQMMYPSAFSDPLTSPLVPLRLTFSLATNTWYIAIVQIFLASSRLILIFYILIEHNPQIKMIICPIL